jgi:glycosyltransferase involved in cell wall biosynthesis
MAETVSEMISDTKFDLVHVEHLRAAHFAPLRKSMPVVFDSVDCLTGLFRQMAKAKKNPIGKFVMLEEAWSLRHYEPKVLSRFDRIVITSESERDALTSLDDTLSINVIPNGVDVDYFAPQGRERKAGRFIFAGKMSYSPNAQAAVWFAENVFRTVKKLRKDAEFVIVGSDPPPKVKKLTEESGVSVTGYVADMRPYLDSASVAVVPMQVAVGIQNKTLEAMAMELPVITTGIACRAFGNTCSGIVQADTANATIREALQLIDQPAMAEKIGRRGRSEVMHRFTWKSSADKLQSVYDEVIAAREAKGGDYAEGARYKPDARH